MLQSNNGGVALGSKATGEFATVKAGKELAITVIWGEARHGE
jgi:hypothetical protein